MKRRFPQYFCREAEVDVVLPGESIVSDESSDWLIVSWPGVDEIQFRVRNDGQDETVYAFFPIEEEYAKVAESVIDLIENGKLAISSCNWRFNHKIEP